MIMGEGADAFWHGEAWAQGVFSFLESLQWEEVSAMGRKEGTEQPGRRWEHGVLAGDADGGQVNPSQGFGLCARALGWVLWKFLCGRGMGSHVSFGKLALLLWGDGMGASTQGGREAREERLLEKSR